MFLLVAYFQPETMAKGNYEFVNDGQYHPVDSSDIAFQTAAQGAFRQAYAKAKPQILEPIMKVSVEGPMEFAARLRLDPKTLLIAKAVRT